jgi:hypothetical protein
MNNRLYTAETAKWYSLLNQAQAETKHFLGTDVERYLADMLYRFSCDSAGMLEYPKEGSAIQWNTVREERLIRLQGAGERCLVTAGLFPEHANYAGLSLLHFIDKGRYAYHNLAEEIPGVSIYSDINNSFVELVDVLQKIGELSGVCQPINLIQACELWQQEGSQFGWLMIQNTTDAFPGPDASSATH